MEPYLSDRKHCTETYNPDSFKRLKKVESWHFWFVVRRRWILDRIKKYVAPPAKILEVGCGAGNVSSFLSTAGYEVTGCELHQEAIEFAWPGFKIVKADATELPFKDNSFDVVGLFDVIEHLDDPTVALKETRRVLVEDGIAVVTVPAREELWSYYDERALHRRRYTKDALISEFKQAGFSPLSVEYMFMALYLPMKLLRRKHKSAEDEFKISPLMNEIMKFWFNMERVFSKAVPLPIGTSLIAVAKK